MIIKRIIRSLSVTALVVLALAVPAFAQEDLKCRNANGDETVNCGGELYELVDNNDGYGYDEYPWWGYDDGSSNYLPLLDYGNEYCYDEDACEAIQEAQEELWEAYQDYYGEDYYGY